MIRLLTAEPDALLTAIRNAIDERRIRTWAYDDDGDFTHTAEQWNQLAWLRPVAMSGALVCFIIAPSNAPISRQTYAIYHGRFIEMTLRHFDQQLTASAAATPLPEGDDRID